MYIYMLRWARWTKQKGLHDAGDLGEFLSNGSLGVVLRTYIGYMYIMLNSHTCNAAIFEWFNLVNGGGKYVTSAGTPG